MNFNRLAANKKSAKHYLWAIVYRGDVTPGPQPPKISRGNGCNLFFYLTTKQVIGAFKMFLKTSGGQMTGLPLLVAGLRHTT